MSLPYMYNEECSPHYFPSVETSTCACTSSFTVDRAAQHFKTDLDAAVVGARWEERDKVRACTVQYAHARPATAHV